MSEAKPTERLPKLPLATYDIVVYFGVGITAFPFLYHYFLGNSGIKLPPIFEGYTDNFVNSTVSLVALGFVTYIIGHGVAITSSLLIEQFVHRSFGPPSRIITNSVAPSTYGSSSFRHDLRNRFYESYRRSPTIVDFIRLIFHIPVIPIYGAMWLLRVHGFYETKINAFVVLRVQNRLEEQFDFSESILSNVRWFKIVEYACANDHPVATARMYNYLVIYGLFRSVSFLLLSSIWLEIILKVSSGGVGFIDQAGGGNLFIRLAVLYGAYTISFIGFCKFSRRYAEEAVQAFALSRVFLEK